jgi:hypothetical protein
MGEAGNPDAPHGGECLSHPPGCGPPGERLDAEAGAFDGVVLLRGLLKRSQITVRHGKGGKDRRTMLPARVAEKLQTHLQEVRRLHRQDLADGYGRVRLPHALGRKNPHAPVA